MESICDFSFSVRPNRGQEYPAAQQKAFADYLMEVMGLDRSHCGLGETEHPFTLEFNNKDVRDRKSVV